MKNSNVTENTNKVYTINAKGGNTFTLDLNADKCYFNGYEILNVSDNADCLLLWEFTTEYYYDCDWYEEFWNDETNDYDWAALCESLDWLPDCNGFTFKKNGKVYVVEGYQVSVKGYDAIENPDVDDDYLEDDHVAIGVYNNGRREKIRAMKDLI